MFGLGNTFGMTEMCCVKMSARRWNYHGCGLQRGKAKQSEGKVAIQLQYG